MAIPKHEATSTFTSQCQRDFDDIERKIDCKIRSDYVGSAIAIGLDKSFRMKRCEKRLRRYIKRWDGSCLFGMISGMGPLLL